MSAKATTTPTPGSQPLGDRSGALRVEGKLRRPERDPYVLRSDRRHRPVGLDSQDSRDEAQAFLARFPVSYPSVFDEDARQARSIGGGQGWPTTIFFDATGRRTFVREGGYTTIETLDADIRRCALGRP